MNRLLLPLTFILVAFFGTGCGLGISGGRIHFAELRYPASMSNSLYGPTGEIARQGGSLRIVREFAYSMDYCSTFYSLISLSRSEDISDQMNAEIEGARGDGMINISIAADYSRLNSVMVLDLLPIWPGCSEIRVRGDIVKFVGQ